MSEHTTQAQAIQHLEKSYNEKPMVYKDESDGRWVIRNSKIGTCPRELLDVESSVKRNLGLQV